MIEQQRLTKQICVELGLPHGGVSGVLKLLDDKSTVPFIARYRKEATGNLDEVAIAAIRDCRVRFVALEDRREKILTQLQETDQLTSELKKQIISATDLPDLEDIYLPFRPKRKTRGSKAREQGLEKAAALIAANRTRELDYCSFFNPEKGVHSKTDILSGAKDIIAEDIADNAEIRGVLRQLYQDHAVIDSRVIEKKREIGEKYTDYFTWQEPASKAPSHRLLAMYRGENEKILKLSIRPAKELGLKAVKKIMLHPGPWQTEISDCIEDSYQRLLAPSMENELRKTLKQRADAEAIQVFSENIRQLLLSPPLGLKRVLAIDPGFRTGAKLACLDEQGNVLETGTVYPTLGEKKKELAATEVLRLVEKFKIEAVAIGNGTAGRETEIFVREINLDPDILITLISEDGASIYSASEKAREEFPNLDLTIRGAISIGRRLQDPLAELIKIDPKSIGVGQYQHDVDQNRLQASLNDVVESSVNNVGVELNSASIELLTHVAGLNQTIAANIIKYREEKGLFNDRMELKKIPRLGPKTFEQCAGFLRIRNGKNPLDNTAVHPERYTLVSKIAAQIGTDLKNLLNSQSWQHSFKIEDFINEKTGRNTLEDILTEIGKPGRDPRKKFEQFSFDINVHSIEDLQEGMKLPAIITNITKFGAFADIGIKQDGLIHISQMADRYIKDPGEIVYLGQKLVVKVLNIDTARKRIALSLK